MLRKEETAKAAAVATASRQEIVAEADETEAGTEAGAEATDTNIPCAPDTGSNRVRLH